MSSPRKGVNHGGKKLTVKEILADKARVDAAMEQIEAAKAKAKAQRAEYAKYLEWKVNLQRKERKSREEEDAAMRERVEEKLREVLREHREQVKKEKQQWSLYKESAPKPHPPLKLANGLAQEEEFVRQRLAARKAHIEESTIAFRRTLPPKSAPSRGMRKPSEFSASGPAPGSEPRLEGAASIRSAGEKILADSKANGELNMSAIASFVYLPPITSTTASALASVDGSSNAVDEFGQLIPLSPEAKHRQKILNASRNHFDTVEDMFQKARTRRLYATGRMLADPPADYILSTDIMRYIPADILEADRPQLPASGHHSPAKVTDRDTVFLTQDQQVASDDEGKGTRPLDDTDPKQLSRSYVKDQAANSGKKLKWKRWDPDAWMKLPEPSSIKIVEHRQPEEENATLEWYHNYYEQYTKVKKRTEKVRSYTWKRCDRHLLPPVESIKFDEQ